MGAGRAWLRTDGGGVWRRRAGRRVVCFPDDAELRVGRGFAPTAMVVLDLDDDGALDVAAVNPSRATLSIHWGDAEGRLERMSSWPLGQAVAGVTHGDLDGDGRVDLATALPDSDAVAVLYNRGARGFVLRRHAAGSAPRGLLAVQFYCSNDSVRQIELQSGTILAVEALLADEEGNIWVGDLNALYKIPAGKVSQLHFNRTTITGLQPHVSFNKRVFALAADSKQNIYAGSYDGIFRIKKNGGPYENIWTNPEPRNPVRSVAAVSPDSIFWNCLDRHPGQDDKWQGYYPFYGRLFRPDCFC